MSNLSLTQWLFPGNCHVFNVCIWPGTSQQVGNLFVNIHIQAQKMINSYLISYWPLNVWWSMFSYCNTSEYKWLRLNDTCRSCNQTHVQHPSSIIHWDTAAFLLPCSAWLELANTLPVSVLKTSYIVVLFGFPVLNHRLRCFVFSSCFPCLWLFSALFWNLTFSLLFWPSVHFLSSCLLSCTKVPTGPSVCPGHLTEDADMINHFL